MSTNSQEGKALYQTFIVDACRNVVHILEDLKSCKPPIDHICELLPRLQPRYYSISSSPKVCCLLELFYCINICYLLYIVKGLVTFKKF